ncbi:MAG: hypothetical protein IT374_18235 [Polyangiaceae bacterium]|nr:hypothetical protein [Polyangiaceae bacterium]
MGDYLRFSRWTCDAGAFEIARRPRLDTRQIVPYFDVGGVRHVGVLSRRRVSRTVRGAPALGWEAIGIELSDVDETGDVLSLERAMFAERTGVRVDDDALTVPLPSHARSVGYLAELSLPLAVPIVPPGCSRLDVRWSGGEHEVLFLPLDEARGALGARPAGEDLALLLAALGPSLPRAAPALPELAAAVLGARAHVVTADDLAVHASASAPRVGTREELPAVELGFLRQATLDADGARWSVLTPSVGESVAVVPLVRAGSDVFVVLARELRPALAERALSQPIFDLPVHPLHVNALARYLSPGAATATELAEAALSPSLAGSEIAWAERLPPLEPAPGITSELRHVVLAGLASLPARLPEFVVLVELGELGRALASGSVRDPVVALALDALGRDPFSAARAGAPAARRAFVAAMTQGSVVERRLRGYSSIEQEQLLSPTYARLMTLLQHEHGVRVVFPASPRDRGFFKASFRVFMADDRPDQRDKQGLHWSHDAFHFALGNYAPPATRALEAWYASDEPTPPASPPEGREWEAYRDALKTAEDEATFFSFYTLLDERPSLARHVGQLTYRDALLSLGVRDAREARRLFDELTREGRVPPELARASDPAAASLFSYMAGFRDYHDKDIRAAYAYASRDPYRATLAEFGLYSCDHAAYVAGVRGFAGRLEAIVPSLNPLLARLAEVRLDLHLRVWDVIKALKLARAATSSVAARADVFARLTSRLPALRAIDREIAGARALVRHAELTPENERLLGVAVELGAAVERSRDELWAALAQTGLVGADVLAEERAREVPR